MHKDFTKELLHLDDNVIIYDEKLIGKYHYIYIKYPISPHKCPRCSRVTKRIHDYRTRTIKHGQINHYFGIIKYNRRRYLCLNCNCKFPEENRFVRKHHKISQLTAFQVVHYFQNNFPLRPPLN